MISEFHGLQTIPTQPVTSLRASLSCSPRQALPLALLPTVRCHILTTIGTGINPCILTRTPSKPPAPQDLYISRPVTQVYFPPPLNFSESRRIRILSRSRACRARAYAREFASVDFLQPLENSRAAREFSGNLPENSFTGSGQYWNSGIGTVLEFPMISNTTLRVISSRGVSSAD